MIFAFLFDRRSGLLTGLALLAIGLLLFGGGVLLGLSLRGETTLRLPPPHWTPPELPWKTPAAPAPKAAPEPSPATGEPEESPIPGEWVPMREGDPQPASTPQREPSP